eukprot:SAG22_NODE_616_length_8539_cov_5.330213_8_plen_324_part_00
MNIEDIIKENKPTIVDSSVKAYVNNIKKLHQKMHATKEVESLDWLKDPDKVISFLDENTKSYLTVRNFLNALIVLLMKEEEMEHALVSFQNKRDELNDRYQERQEKGEMTERQQEAWIPLKDIQDFVGRLNLQLAGIKPHRELSTGDRQLFQDRLMVKFWITYPLRNDLADTQVMTRGQFANVNIEDRTNNNYIIVSPKSMRLHIANYKTKKTYGIKTIKIEDKDVIRYMRDWLKASPNPDYALVNLKTGKPMNGLQITQTFLRIFQDEFNKKVSTSMLRHIVVTDTFGQVIQDMDELADVMMHSKSMQHTVYNKFDASTVSA